MNLGAITERPNLGAWDTGLPGSNRQPRIMASVATALAASAGGSAGVMLSPARFVNERPEPLFVDTLVFSIDTTDTTIYNQLAARLTMAGHQLTPTFVPVPAFMDTILNSSFRSITAVWKFVKPFVLLHGEGIQIELQNGSSSAVTVAASALSYYESLPRPVKTRFMPAILHDQLIVASSTTAYMTEEALRNDHVPFEIAGLFLQAMNTSTNLVQPLPLSATGGVLLRLTAKEADAQTQVTDLATLVIQPLGYPQANFAIPLTGTLDPFSTFSAEIQNADTFVTYQVDLSIIGYKEMELPA